MKNTQKNNNENNIILAIFFSSVLTRIFYYRGITSPDDFAYARSAYEITKGIFNSVGWYYGLRHLMTIPTAVFYFLLGVGEMQSIIWPLICYAFEFLFIIKICRKLSPDINAIIPAVLLSFYPLDMLYSFALSPDIVISAVFSAAFYLMLVAIDRGKLFYYLAVGAVVWTGHYAKEYAPVFNLVIIACLIYKIGINRKLIIPILILLIGNLIIFSIVETTSWYFSGHFLCRYTKLIPKYFAIDRDLTLRGHFVSNPLFYLKCTFFSKELGLYFYLLAASIFFIIKDKNKKLNLLLIWLFGLFIFLNFVPLKLNPLILSFKSARYLTVLTCPMIIIGSYFVNNFFEKKEIAGKIKGITILCLVVLTGFYCFITHPFLRMRARMPNYITSQYLKTLKPYPIVLVHYQMRNEFLYYFKHKRRVYIYNAEWKQGELSKKPYYLVIDKKYFPGSGSIDTIKNLYPELLNPPANWLLIKAFNNEVFVENYYPELLKPPAVKVPYNEYSLYLVNCVEQNGKEKK